MITVISAIVRRKDDNLYRAYEVYWMLAVDMPGYFIALRPSIVYFIDHVLFQYSK